MNQAAIDDPEARKKKDQHIPMKRAAQPEEVARLALFLASADADYVTGLTYVMDGGFMRSSAQGRKGAIGRREGDGWQRLRANISERDLGAGA